MKTTPFMRIVALLLVPGLLLDPAIVLAGESAGAGHRPGPAQQSLFATQALALRETGQLDPGLSPVVAKADLFKTAGGQAGFEIAARSRQQNGRSEEDRLVFKRLDEVASAEDLASLFGISLYSAHIAFSLLKGMKEPRRWHDFVRELEHAVALPENFARRTPSLYARLLREARPSLEKMALQDATSGPKSVAGNSPAKPNLKDIHLQKASIVDTQKKRLETARILAGRTSEFTLDEFLEAFWEERRPPANGGEFIRELEYWAQGRKNDPAWETFAWGCFDDDGLLLEPFKIYVHNHLLSAMERAPGPGSQVSIRNQKRYHPLRGGGPKDPARARFQGWFQPDGTPARFMGVSAAIPLTLGNPSRRKIEGIRDRLSDLGIEAAYVYPSKNLFARVSSRADEGHQTLSASTFQTFVVELGQKLKGLGTFTMRLTGLTVDPEDGSVSFQADTTSERVNAEVESADFFRLPLAAYRAGVTADQFRSIRDVAHDSEIDDLGEFEVTQIPVMVSLDALNGRKLKMGYYDLAGDRFRWNPRYVNPSGNLKDPWDIDAVFAKEEALQMKQRKPSAPGRGPGITRVVFWAAGALTTLSSLARPGWGQRLLAIPGAMRMQAAAMSPPWAIEIVVGLAALYTMALLRLLSKNPPFREPPVRVTNARLKSGSGRHLKDYELTTEGSWAIESLRRRWSLYTAPWKIALGFVSAAAIAAAVLIGIEGSAQRLQHVGILPILLIMTSGSSLWSIPFALNRKEGWQTDARAVEEWAAGALGDASRLIRSSRHQLIVLLLAGGAASTALIVWSILNASAYPHKPLGASGQAPQSLARPASGVDEIRRQPPRLSGGA